MRLLLLFFLAIYWSEQFRYLKFPSNRKIPETKKIEEHFALLKNDPSGELPDKFSICSSVFVGYFRDWTTFWTVLKKDKTWWFSLSMYVDLMVEKYVVWMDKEPSSIPLDEGLSLRPWAWSHACISIDVKSGHVTVAINGKLLLNTTVQDTQFLQSKPSDLTNKIQLGDWKYPNFKV